MAKAGRGYCIGYAKDAVSHETIKLRIYSGKEAMTKLSYITSLLFMTKTKKFLLN